MFATHYLGMHHKKCRTTFSSKELVSRTIRIEFDPCFTHPVHVLHRHSLIVQTLQLVTSFLQT
jgi:hypothetical protein